MAEERKRGRGRPKAKIDLSLVEAMASEFCTQEEIADDMGFSRELFRTRNDVKDAYLKGMQGGRISLRSFQFQSARAGNVQMQIWLGKQYLGQKEQATETEHTQAEEPKNGLIDALNTRALEVWQDERDTQADV